MLKSKDYFKFLVIMLAVFLGTGLAAQDLDDAKSLAREGKTALDGEEYDIAVQKMEESIDICEELWEEEEDEEAETLMKQLKQMMPTIYLKAGLTYANKGQFDDAIATLEKCNDASLDMGKTDVLAKSQGLLSKIYLSLAGSKYSAATKDAANINVELLKEALADVTHAIEQDDDSMDAYKLKIGILRKLEDDAALIETTRALLAVSGKMGEKTSIAKMSATYFYNKGLMAKNSTEYDAALESLKLCVEFDNENADAYYLLALIYNTQEKWEDAIAAGSEGMKYEKPDKMARTQYELGTAYFNTGDKASACSAYKEAALGSAYKESAEYQMKHVVKCD